MPINDLAQELEEAARTAALQTGALEACRFHTYVLVRKGNADAERHAYARATTTLKRDGTMFLREDLMSAIKTELDMAADGECPECARIREA